MKITHKGRKAISVIYCQPEGLNKIYILPYTKFVFAVKYVGLNCWLRYSNGNVRLMLDRITLFVLNTVKWLVLHVLNSNIECNYFGANVNVYRQPRPTNYRCN